jgi:hypothetical protein
VEISRVKTEQPKPPRFRSAQRKCRKNAKEGFALRQEIPGGIQSGRHGIENTLQIGVDSDNAQHFGVIAVIMAL